MVSLVVYWRYLNLGLKTHREISPIFLNPELYQHRMVFIIHLMITIIIVNNMEGNCK